MKKLYTLPTWAVFLLCILPAFFPSSLASDILSIIWAAFWVYCIYFLGNYLYKKLPAGHGMHIKRFNFFLFFAVTYLLSVFILFDGGYDINQDNYKEYGDTLYFILPLHFFTMYCIFYTIRFLAKSIAAVTYKKVVGPDKYLGIFFLLLFFPIGVWWVHPKVRNIFTGSETHSILIG